MEELKYLECLIEDYLETLKERKLAKENAKTMDYAEYQEWTANNYQSNCSKANLRRKRLLIEETMKDIETKTSPYSFIPKDEWN